MRENRLLQVFHTASVILAGASAAQAMEVVKPMAVDHPVSVTVEGAPVGAIQIEGKGVTGPGDGRLSSSFRSANLEAGNYSVHFFSTEAEGVLSFLIRITLNPGPDGVSAGYGLFRIKGLWKSITVERISNPDDVPSTTDLIRHSNKAGDRVFTIR